MRNKIILSFTVLMTCSLFLNSQSENTSTNSRELKSVLVIHERDETGITLRWVPSDPELWLITNRGGYEISRMVYENEEEINLEKFKPLAKGKAKDKEAWLADMKAMKEVPPYLAGSYECIYGEYKSLKEGQGFSAWQEQAGELRNKYTFNMYMADLDQQAASYSGLLFKDKKVVNGIKYAYRIDPIINEDVNMVYSPGIVLVGTQYTEYESPQLDAEEGDGKITLRWNREYLNTSYTAYYIERAESNGQFKRLNEVPYIHGLSDDADLYNPNIIYTDSVANYKPYRYRVVGLTPFADEGPYSNVISKMGRDLTAPPPPSQLDYFYMGGSNMVIKWQQEPCGDLEGYYVFRGHDMNDNFYRLHDDMITDEKQFIDTTAYELAENYYLVASVDTAGNIAESLLLHAIMIDTVPPEPPTGLKGEIDTSGVLTLQWKHNKELDIRGYKVYFSNASEHEFSLLTGQAIRDTVYKTDITLDTHTEEAYFKVMAVDNRYNYSYLSEPVKIMRPDTVPPSSPIFTDYKVEKGKIFLQWANSESKDLSRHELHRKHGSTGIWETLMSFTKSEKEYTDEAVEAGEQYIYRIIAIDDADLVSEIANDLYLEAPRDMVEDGIRNLTALNEKNKGIKLKWEFSSSASHSIVIYKSMDDAGFELLGTLDGPQREFVDEYVLPGHEYAYTVKVTFSDGKQSGFSSIATSMVNAN